MFVVWFIYGSGLEDPSIYEHILAAPPARYNQGRAYSKAMPAVTTSMGNCGYEHMKVHERTHSGLFGFQEKGCFFDTIRSIQCGTSVITSKGILKPGNFILDLCLTLPSSQRFEQCRRAITWNNVTHPAFL